MSKSESQLNIDPKEMLETGMHFGHRTSAAHPKMKPFVFGTRNGVQIIDLEKTAEKLKEAIAFVQEVIKNDGKILFVGTKIQMKKIVEETAKGCNSAYVSERWLGGTFTNFETIKKRVAYLKSLQKQKQEGLLEKYTKKERAKFDREMAGLERRLGGIVNMEKIPEVIFVCDMKKDLLAIKEAKKKNVKIIGIADVNIDPGLADYPIPANDDAIKSVKYILDRIKEAILQTKPEPKKEQPEDKKKKT
ncbi:30S ribosomal protein S2 [Candidatus Parcubacteria bacterium]|nr:30S ribosomal protein S2 [Patescibacteria group bacterium]MBU4466518.1 30S ribosomal protein S2 [Patescibacteria group bacterium]MCG2688327.1 30S ribosomal protein S2 [Candidatus Parcubacteria bacterium]